MINVNVCSFILQILSQAQTIDKYPIVYFTTKIALSNLTQAVFSTGSITERDNHA